MAKYYYTTSEEPKAVYHVSQNCEEGKRIGIENRVDTDIFPSGRVLCALC